MPDSSGALTQEEKAAIKAKVEAQREIDRQAANEANFRQTVFAPGYKIDPDSKAGRENLLRIEEAAQKQAVLQEQYNLVSNNPDNREYVSQLARTTKDIGASYPIGSTRKEEGFGRSESINAVISAQKEDPKAIARQERINELESQTSALYSEARKTTSTPPEKADQGYTQNFVANPTHQPDISLEGAKMLAASGHPFSVSGNDSVGVEKNAATRLIAANQSTPLKSNSNEGIFSSKFTNSITTKAGELVPNKVASDKLFVQTTQGLVNKSTGEFKADSLFSSQKPTEKPADSNKDILSPEEFKDYFTKGVENNATFLFYNKAGKEVGESSGKRAFGDFFRTQQKFGEISVKQSHAEAEASSIVSEAKSKGASKIQIFSPEGVPVGSIRVTGAKDVLTNMIKTSPFQYGLVSNREQQTESSFQFGSGSLTSSKLKREEENREVKKYIADVNAEKDPSYYFNIRDEKGSVVKTTTGDRAYYDFMKESGKNPKGVSIDTHYSHTLQANYARFDQAYKKATIGDLGSLVELPKAAISLGAGMAASLYSTVAFASKNKETASKTLWKNIPIEGEQQINSKEMPGLALKIKEGSLQFQYPLALTQAARGIMNTLVFGLDIKKSYQAGEIRGDKQPITHSAERTFSPYIYPTSFGASMGGSKFPDTRFGMSLSLIPFEYMAIEGARGLSKAVPFRYEKFPEITTAEGKTVPMQKGILLGYGGRGSRQLMGTAGGKFKLGEPKYEEIRPEGSKRVIANPERGDEMATPSGYQTAKLGNPKYWERVEKIGASSRPIESNLQSNLIKMTEVGSKPPTNTQYRNILETKTEGVNELVIKTGEESLGKQQSKINLLNPVTLIKKGIAGKLQGSRSTEQFLPEDFLGQMRQVASPKDIDAIKSNPYGVAEEYQAINLARETQRRMDIAQGIESKKGVSFHATSGKVATGIINKGVDYTKSKFQKIRGEGFFTMNKAEGLERFGGRTLKIKYNPSDILEFKKIPKAKRGELAEEDWLSFQSNVMGYGRDRGYFGVTKPYKNTKGVASANPNAQLNEIIFLKEGSIKSIELLPKDITFTEQVGRRITAGKQKIMEYVTRKDETGSSAKKSGQVYGYPIDTKTFKSFPKGSTTSVKHTSGIYQMFSNIAKSAAQNKESAIAQAATTKQLKIIGEGEYISPELFKQGTPIIRTYYQTLATSRELLKNPETRKLGMQGIAAAHETRYYQFDNPKTALYDWKSSLRLASKDKELSTLVPSRSLPSSSILGSSSFIGSNLGSLSEKSGLSGLSGKSGLSSFSGKSGLSGLSGKSSLSGLSSISGISGKSGISSFSEKSGLSSKSSVSNVSAKSGLSSVSGKSGISGLSGKSGLSGLSGLSGKSGISGLSGLSGFSSKSGFSTTQPSKIPLVFAFGNLGFKKKRRAIEKGTFIFKWNVRNAFSSNLDIIDPRSYKGKTLI